MLKGGSSERIRGWETAAQCYAPFAMTTDTFAALLWQLQLMMPGAASQTKRDFFLTKPGLLPHDSDQAFLYSWTYQANLV
jgi:hypothetical protein